ncbi:MAG: dihydropteroate synthase [Deltaproteobacteria bacterium]|nr:dihydropteroate synthase [Deltaproteobacteria bacterium]
MSRMKIGSRFFNFKKEIAVMGILNVTPDSFSDGDCWLDPEKALEQALKMAEEGADLIDIGGESTRPGAPSVSLEEEKKRVLPVLKKIRPRLSIPISIDTQKAALAREALEEGADLINDVSAATFDPEMASVVGKAGCPLVLMHMRGRPETMQKEIIYRDVVGEVLQYLQQRIESLSRIGVSRDRLIMDPGIGFGKEFEHNRQLLQNLRKFQTLECPVMVGVSRKSFLGKISGRVPQDRLLESVAASFYAALNGASILRVHDVAETRRVLNVAEALLKRA